MRRVSTLAAACTLIVLAGCQATTGGQSSAGTTTTTTSTSAKVTTTPAAPSTVTLPDGLKYQDLKIGDGAIAENGLEASVHYTGWFENGEKFASSLDTGQPLTFRIGAGQVIAGWEEGVRGMRVGGKRHLIVPPELAYGASGRGGVIPPNSTLLFDVELLGLR